VTLLATHKSQHSRRCRPHIDGLEIFRSSSFARSKAEIPASTKFLRYLQPASMGHLVLLKVINRPLRKFAAANSATLLSR